MLDLLKQSNSLNQETIDILRQYQCGYEGHYPKVCCPDGPILIGKPKNPVAPDVTNHRNLKLLPDDCGMLPGRNRIIGGNKTSLFEFPWMALLSYETGNKPNLQSF